MSFLKKTMQITEIQKKKKKKTLTRNRSSHQRFYVKKGVLRHFAKFTGKHLSQSLFFNKVTVLNIFLTEYLWATASVEKS